MDLSVPKRSNTLRSGPFTEIVASDRQSAVLIYRIDLVSHGGCRKAQEQHRQSSQTRCFPSHAECSRGVQLLFRQRQVTKSGGKEATPGITRWPEDFGPETGLLSAL
jgi:hypothetical protein